MGRWYGEAKAFPPTSAPAPAIPKKFLRVKELFIFRIDIFLFSDCVDSGCPLDVMPLDLPPDNVVKNSGGNVRRIFNS
jgi:hypothetical protein